MQYIKLRDDHADILGDSANVATSIDIVQQNGEWMNLHQKEIGQWLKPLEETTSTTSSTDSSTSKQNC